MRLRGLSMHANMQLKTKPKLLCILHRSPPAHGAARIGDFIADSEKLKEAFDCRFVTIKSSDTIGDIGKVNFKKLYLVVELYVKVLWALLTFRPQKIYFTASIRSVALYRDLLISTLWKMYSLFKPVEVFYHYHTKGVDEYVSSSARNLKLTRFFVKDVNLILLSSLLKKDFEQVKSYKKVYFLPNGVEDPLKNEDFDTYIAKKYEAVETIEALYLAHIMKEKGYWEVLELAKETKGSNIRYHFAGSWKDKESEAEFSTFVEEHGLEEQVVYHGFVSGEQKADLFKRAYLLLYPSKNDAFPLTLLEALAYGVPVVATAEGSIPYILDEKSGIVLEDVEKLPDALEEAKEKLLDRETAAHCRQRYLENFSLERFEEKLVKILQENPLNNPIDQEHLPKQCSL